MKHAPTIKSVERFVFGRNAKGFSVKSTKQPGIDQPKPRHVGLRK